MTSPNDARDPSGPPTTPGSHMLVAIGASAGGLDPLRELLTSLPAEPGAAFVVLQHLSPDTPSFTPELLQPHVAMPLAQAEDGATPRVNEVAFLPPGASLQVAGERFRLIRDGEHRRTGVVIDTFLCSLARERGPRAVGILLSGGGWDGSYGLKTIRDAGGLTMVQDPESAEFDSMPANAIRSGVVDVVQPAAELARTLVQYLARGEEVADLGADGTMRDSLTSILMKALRTHTGHDFSEYKRGTLTRRTVRRRQLLGWPTLDAYVAEVERDPEEARRLVSDLLIGVTGFYRDPESWQELETRVVPELFANRDAREPVRAWVIGCASGEEAYSLAMLLHERAAETPEAPTPMVFATDIDGRAIELARDGAYPEAAVSAVPPVRRDRFFRREEPQLRLVDAVRESCIFAEHNALRDPPFSQLDFVSCRNLMIYLQPSAQETLTEILAFALKPGGFLILGSSETLDDRRGLFEPVHAKYRIFRRSELSASPPMGVLGRSLVGRPPWARARSGSPKQAGDDRRERRRTVEQMLLRDFGPAALLVNDRREVLDYFGPTRRYVEPSQARGGRSVTEMVLPPLQGPLRAVLRTAEREGREVTRHDVRLGTGDDADVVQLTVRPVGDTRGEKQKGTRFLIVLRQPTGAAPPPHRRPATTAVSATVDELEEELRDTEERLQATIEQLETANEELQSSNEELLSINEEFQTSKEEALSANEELQLVNEELRTKVAELDKAHADLENLFHSTQVATLFLDRKRRIQRFTPSMSRLFRLRPSDLGRPIQEITPRFDHRAMEEAIERVLDRTEPAQMEIHAPEDDAWYNFRVSPYHAQDGEIEGVVLTFADITEIKRNEERIREEQLYAQSIIETVQQPLVVLASELQVVSASRSFFDTFGYQPEEVLGVNLFELGGDAWQTSGLRKQLEGILPDGQPVEGVELEFELPRFGRRRMLASARRLFSRETDRILLNLQDVTDYWDRVHVQEEEARRKDWFLAMLGHELRGPLAPIRNSIALLREHDPEPEHAKRLLEIIDRQVKHLARLVNDLLDLSRIAEGKLSLERTPVDLVRVVQETVQDHRSRLEEAGLRLDLTVPADPLWLEADANRLQQAIGNLIDNARKYTPRGGRVEIVAQQVSQAVAEVVVGDTGVGMSRDTLDAAFEPFRQGPRETEHPKEGLGIGLTLVRNVADAHGGAVRAESDGPGRGSRLTLRLPLVRRDMLRSGGEAFPPPPAEAKETVSRQILLVEDQQYVAETTEQLLQAAGHVVRTVSSGEAAIDAIRELRADVVICDLGLPGRTSGHGVARAVRSDPNLEGVYLVALTGFGQDKDREKALESGFDAFLVKPASSEELEEVLAEAGRPDAA